MTIETMSEIADVYTEALQPLLTPFLNGFNVTVLAYGQTGSGKTYTVGNKTNVTPATSPARPVNPNAESTSHKIGENDGLLPRFLCDLFASLRKEPSVKTIYVSFLEIYCDEVRDLLQQNRAGNAKDSQLVIREDEHKVWVENLRQLQIENVEKALELMNLGRTKQIVSSNALNDTSSRSHAIYTMEVSRKFVNEIKKTKLTFVDLAGSERLKKTQVEGVRMKESIQINEPVCRL
uniref:Kinesin motor domain-containing protein n=1 Tax=Globisporangium ultimum (strain ATCC 200006 / CBS 805.95 / DAOM BR144) TaxID=431595 RepID=K3X0N1_GLOUD